MHPWYVGGMDKLRKLTPDVHDLLVYGTRRGRKTSDICKLAGVTPKALRTWLALADQDERAMQLLVDMEAAKLELRQEIDRAMTSSFDVLRNALVIAAYRKAEALDSEDERVVQAAATEILDRFHGKPTQSINANVTAAVAVKGYIGINPDEWDTDDQSVPATEVASGAVEGQESDSAADG